MKDCWRDRRSRGRSSELSDRHSYSESGDGGGRLPLRAQDEAVSARGRATQPTSRWQRSARPAMFLQCRERFGAASKSGQTWGEGILKGPVKITARRQVDVKETSCTNDVRYQHHLAGRSAEWARVALAAAHAGRAAARSWPSPRLRFPTASHPPRLACSPRPITATRQPPHLPPRDTPSRAPDE